MKYMKTQTLLAPFRRAIEDYKMIEEGDKIGFIGENIHLVGDGSSKIMLDTKNTTGNFSIAKEIVYFPILDGKAQIGIKKDSYIKTI